MKACEAMVAWNPPAGSGLPLVRVFPWPDSDDAAAVYRCTAGACYVPGLVVADFHAQGDRLLLSLLAQFHQLVVGHGLPAAVVHAALLDIDEYRDADFGPVCSASVTVP